jgi:hypothetical protein
MEEEVAEMQPLCFIADCADLIADCADGVLMTQIKAITDFTD